MRSENTGQSAHTGDICRYLMQHGGISQQSLASELGLSMPTLLQGLKELRKLELIRDDTTFESTGGRKARMIRIDPDARISIGIELTANHVSLVAVDLLGHILHANRIRHPFKDSYYYYATLGRLLRLFIEDNRLDPSRILGLGIALDAIIAPDRRSLHHSRLREIPNELSDKLERHLSLPFLLFESASSGGYAEWWNRETGKTILYLSLSNSVGGAMIDHYNLYRGDNRKCCDFGHMTLVPGGKKCYCGMTGCSNAYLHASLLSDLAGGKMDRFFLQVENRDPACTEALQSYLRDLSILIHNLRMMYDCDIVLGGYVGAFLEPYMEDLREMVRVRSAYREPGTFLTTCRHKYHAAAMGAALHFVTDFIQNL